MKSSSRCLLLRWLIYLLGCVFLSCGIILNTKTGLGVSPLISLSYCVSKLTGMSFSLLTFALYTLFCLLQFPIKGKNRRWTDLLQIPFSIGFTLLMNLFSAGLPAFSSVPGKAIGLILAIVCTGTGVPLMVGMELIPNPADALASAIGTVCGKGLGFGKNLMDITCVLLTVLLCILFLTRLHANGYSLFSVVGIGTVCASIFTGRVMALVNHLLRARIRKLTGLE